ncbi:hypothetical protein TUM4261_40920 [Shewanella sp. c952]|nr:hypothetical protein TUM4261_40920 [Shewanella sp. c952]
MTYKTYAVNGMINGQPNSKHYQATNIPSAINMAFMDGFSDVSIREV